MSEESKLISGTYLVERKWGLIWLDNKLKNIHETVKDNRFYIMLLQAFGIDHTNKILEALSEEKKLIIDFDEKKVKLVESKDVPFNQSLKFYFNPMNIQRELDTGERIDIFGYEEEEENNA